MIIRDYDDELDDILREHLRETYRREMREEVDLSPKVSLHKHSDEQLNAAYHAESENWNRENIVIETYGNVELRWFHVEDHWDHKPLIRTHWYV